MAARRKMEAAPLLREVQETIERRELLREGDAVLVAVSGGLDSVALLITLHELSAKQRWKLVVAHFNHQLRGKESDADERFVKRLCERLEVRCICGSGDVLALAVQAGESVEMSARQARHTFFAMAARSFGIRAIALAHHADDQLELFFVRLFRGAGSSGLAGMKWQSPSPEDESLTLIRPLLGHTRRQLEAFGQSQRLRYRHDSSNECLDMLRNRIRHKLLPLVREEFGSAPSANILRAMAILGGEEAMFSELAAEWLRRRKPAFKDLHIALQRRVVHDQIVGMEIAPSFELIEWLRSNAGKKITWKSGIELFRDDLGQVFQEETLSEPRGNPHFETALSSEGSCSFSGIEFRWRIERPGKGAYQTTRREMERFDARAVGGHVVFRHWKPGDRFQPIGMAKSVKLQDLFTNAKIPKAQRHKLVLAESAGGEIFWVQGLRIGERFKLTPETTKVLEWRWK